jgi:hypothetical protein
MFEDLIPEMREFATALVNAAGAAGLQPRVTSTRRSHAAQVRLYRRYLTGLSPLPAAPPGQSAHEYGYAFDMVVTPFEALEDVGYTWQTWGGIWPGAADPVHFQYPGFVPDANVVQTAARNLEQLPWYISLFLPISTMVEKTSPTDFTKSPVLCKLFGKFC